MIGVIGWWNGGYHDAPSQPQWHVDVWLFMAHVETVGLGTMVTVQMGSLIALHD